MAEDWITRPMASPPEKAVFVKIETNDMYLGLRERDINILHVLGLTLSSISFMATCLSGYWLMRMRRGFRHE